MDLHGYVHMHVEKNGKHYSFMTPLGSSYEECLDVAQDLVDEIKKLIDDMKVKENEK